jgi:hypothetical protein
MNNEVCTAVIHIYRSCDINKKKMKLTDSYIILCLYHIMFCFISIYIAKMYHNNHKTNQEEINI